eukprot:349875-Chlamydomonas_euryale.AAC.4
MAGKGGGLHDSNGKHCFGSASGSNVRRGCKNVPGAAPEAMTGVAESTVLRAAPVAMPGLTRERLHKSAPRRYAVPVASAAGCGTTVEFQQRRTATWP